MGWFGDVIEGYNWLAKSHQQLYDDIHGGLGLGGGQGTVEHYDNADRMLQQIQQRIEKGVKDLSANWSGGAADGATALTRTSGEWAGAAAVATINARSQSLHQASAYVDARNRMPEPVKVPDISPTGGFPAVKLIVDVAQAKERAGAAHLEAARVMTGYNSSTTEHIGAMPQYPPVSTMVSSGVVVPTQPKPGGGDIENGRTRKPGVGPDTPPQGRPGSGTQPPGTGPGPQPAGGQGPGQGGPGQEQGGEGPGEQPGPVEPGGAKPPNGGTDPNNFPPPSWTPPGGGGNPPGVDIPRPGTQIPGTQIPGTQLPGTQVPFGVPALPTGGLGGGETPGRGLPGEGGRGIPGEGRRGFGKGAGGVAEPVAGPGRGAAGGRGGAGGGSSMTPGAGRANREEDKEHQRKYVVLDDEHLLDDGPPVAPPVIGER